VKLLSYFLLGFAFGTVLLESEVICSFRIHNRPGRHAVGAEPIGIHAIGAAIRRMIARHKCAGSQSRERKMSDIVYPKAVIPFQRRVTPLVRTYNPSAPAVGSADG